MASVPEYGDAIDRPDDRLGCRENRYNCNSGQTKVFRLASASSGALSSHCPRFLVRGADSGDYGGA